MGLFLKVGEKEIATIRTRRCFEKKAKEREIENGCKIR